MRLKLVFTHRRASTRVATNTMMRRVGLTLYLANWSNINQLEMSTYDVVQNSCHWTQLCDFFIDSLSVGIDSSAMDSA